MLLRRIISLLAAISFILNEIAIASPNLAAAYAIPSSEVYVPKSFRLEIPPELGRVQTIFAGDGPTLIHLQTAHGNYEAQKKIESMLHHLEKAYGFCLLLLEGGMSRLDRERIRFFPRDMDLTMRVADGLAKEALLTGAELYLLRSKRAEAYGIEDLESYAANGRAFMEVLKQQELTQDFLADMEQQIERLTAPYLSQNLRSFLRTLEQFEDETLPFEDWLTYLKGKAKECLEVELASPSWQLDWPMLFRVFQLREFESRLDMAAFAEERDRFLNEVKKIPAPIYQEIEERLTSPLSRNQLPNPETGLLFERLVSYLPEDFDYKAFPNVTYFIAHLILQSELKADRLVEEMERLTDQISRELAGTDEAQKILDLLKDYRLLKRLFSLELTPEDFEQVDTELEPSGLV